MQNNGILLIATELEFIQRVCISFKQMSVNMAQMIIIANEVYWITIKHGHVVNVYFVR